ncbi:MAG: MBL fold metallo-hydrolase [Oscillospiraceae bacterium]|nr:MBL fold metallo-hydrolase [Oscillospiraceae bacterium]
MKITYIGHSGFLVETKDCYYIFDYYKGELPALDPHKPVVVFCSHFHHDHFNPEIFERLRKAGMNFQAVLAKDISRNQYPTDIEVIKACPDQVYKLDNGAVISTLRSTDSGVAFIVKTPEGTLYHAGDLNDWYWEGEPTQDNRQMTNRYRKEIDKMKGIHFDAAFVPLDPRQGEHYKDGMLYFLKNVDCDSVYPMHYWNKPDVIQKFTTEFPEYQSYIKNTEQTKGEEV